MRVTRNRLSFVVLLLLLSLCSSLAAAQQYKAMAISPEQYWGDARGVSSSGYVVGTCQVPTGVSQAFIWSEASGFHILNTPAAYRCTAQAVNYKGQVVGWFQDTTWRSHAAFWDSDGTCHDLGLGGLYDLTDSGLALGSIGDANGVFDVNGNAIFLYAVTVAPFCMNEAGQVAGDRYAIGTDGQAFIWSSDCSFRSLETDSDFSSCALAINGSGATAGYHSRTRFDNVPVMWTPDGTRVSIGLLHTTSSGRANGISDAGAVVGVCERSDYNNGSAAFVWTKEDGIQALPGLDGRDSEAYAINSSGWIVGNVTYSSGAQRAVVWVPVPEPSTLAVILSGIAGIGLLVRRRNPA